MPNQPKLKGTKAQSILPLPDTADASRKSATKVSSSSLHYATRWHGRLTFVVLLIRGAGLWVAVACGVGLSDARNKVGGELVCGFSGSREEVKGVDRCVAWGSTEQKLQLLLVLLVIVVACCLEILFAVYKPALSEVFVLWRSKQLEAFGVKIDF
ncbi:hypothetical protein Droror1_Dr00002670 [Drosera rotundifolia]